MNREKSIFEQMGGTYVQVGGYLLPSLGIATIEESRSILIWKPGKRKMSF